MLVFKYSRDIDIDLYIIFLPMNQGDPWKRTTHQPLADHSLTRGNKENERSGGTITRKAEATQATTTKNDRLSPLGFAILLLALSYKPLLRLHHCSFSTFRFRRPSLSPPASRAAAAAVSSMASRHPSPTPTSLSTPLLSDSITPTPATNGHARGHDDLSSADAAAMLCDSDPFAFFSEDHPPRSQGPSPADPFRNSTPGWGDAYGWARALLLAPVAAVRLVLFGLSIAIGYAATWVALRGWTDSRERPREGAGPMPAWRRRLMWVTRISARCILFSFGSVPHCSFMLIRAPVNALPDLVRDLI